MLKIIDSVDLKELEKFGFEFKEETGKWIWFSSLFEYIFVYSWNKKISIDSINGKASSVLIDLFQAGLVEKVEG